MSTDKIVALFKDKEFIEKYNSCKSPLEKSELLSKNGMSISEDEIKSLENYTKNGSSIEDNNLQNISGGVKFKPFIKGAAITLISAASAAGLVYARGKFLDSKKEPPKNKLSISDPNSFEVLPNHDVISPTGENLSESPNNFSPANEDYSDIDFSLSDSAESKGSLLSRLWPF